MILDAIQRFFTRQGISGPIVVAVSGGVDSTALLLALIEMGGFEISAGDVVPFGRQAGVTRCIFPSRNAALRYHRRHT